jgi:radical SAM superfamily enzyme YgiQ (UPF0313 family)
MGIKVVVLAPMVEEKQFNVDLTIRLKNNDRELTLETINQLLLHDLDEDAMTWDLQLDNDIPSAGYYLTSMLKSKGHEVLLSSLYDERTMGRMAAFSPQLICLSTTMILSIEAIREIVERIRKYMPGVFIVAGGVFVWKNFLASQSHYAVNTKDIYDYSLFSLAVGHIPIDAYVAAPHGASSLLMLIKELEKGQNPELKQIPNLIVPKAEGGFTINKRMEELVDFNEDFTQWEYIDEMPARVPLRTSIGCPYRCSFCDFCTLFPKVFMRSPQSLTNELNAIMKRLGNNPYLIHVSDDNVFMNEKRVFEICDVFEKAKVSKWSSFMRASSINEKNIENIKRSGLMMAHLGIESGDAGQLKRMKKMIDIAGQKKGIELLDAHGIAVFMSFLVGFPGETRETLLNTSSFLNNLELHNGTASYFLFPLLMLPLSKMGDPAFRKEHNVSGTLSNWKHKTMDSTQVNRAAYELFSNVHDVQYQYIDESILFNKGAFSAAELQSLFSLRNKLTKQIVEGEANGDIANTFREMAKIMSYDISNLHDDIVEKFYVKDKTLIDFNASFDHS